MSTVAIVGSRTFPAKAGKDFVEKYISRLPRGTKIVSGEARAGADAWAKEAALKRGLPYEGFPVDRTGLQPFPKGKKEFRDRAFARNQQIVDAADWLVCLWDRQSKTKGCMDTVERAKKAKLPHGVIIHGEGNYTLFCTESPENLYLESREGH